MHTTRRLAVGVLLGLLVLCNGCAMLSEGAAGARNLSKRSTTAAILLYLPNRLFDLVEIFRFGVNVGPGIGIDAEATGALRAAVMTRGSVGVGYQGLRHFPVSLGVDTYIAVGPLDPGLRMGWYRSEYDIRVEPHLVLVGFHAAIDLLAIGDFFAGWLMYDLEEDDW